MHELPCCISTYKYKSISRPLPAFVLHTSVCKHRSRVCLLQADLFRRSEGETQSYRVQIYLSTDNLARQQSDSAAEHPCYFASLPLKPSTPPRSSHQSGILQAFRHRNSHFCCRIWLALMAAVRELGVNQNKPTPEILVGGISPGSAAASDWLSVSKHRGDQ